jgi:hypothetical protein
MKNRKLKNAIFLVSLPFQGVAMFFISKTIVLEFVGVRYQLALFPIIIGLTALAFCFAVQKLLGFRE